MNKNNRRTEVETSTEAAIVGNTVLPAFDFSDRYRNIKTEENYMSLLKSGMFWEFHPELTGNWCLDESVINSR